MSDELRKQKLHIGTDDFIEIIRLNLYRSKFKKSIF